MVSTILGLPGDQILAIRACRSSMKPSRRTAICVSSRDGPGWLALGVGPQLSELGINEPPHTTKHRIGDDWSVFFFFLFFRHFLIENERLKCTQDKCTPLSGSIPCDGNAWPGSWTQTSWGATYAKGDLCLSVIIFLKSGSSGSSGSTPTWAWIQSYFSIFILDEHPKLPAILL